MSASCLSSINNCLNKPDFSRLLLRLSLGGLLLFHGWHKMMSGIGPIQGMLAAHGMPAFIGYGVYVGEVVAPILIILGVLCRLSALMVIGTMLVAWLLAGIGNTFHVDAVGAWAIESIAFYTLMSLVLLFQGAGRYSLAKNDAWR